jgi:hypothetical protein
MKAIRFDSAAATPVDPRVPDAVLPLLGERDGDPPGLRRAATRAW